MVVLKATMYIMYIMRLSPLYTSMISHTGTRPDMELRLRTDSEISHSHRAKATFYLPVYKIRKSPQKY